MRPINYRVWNKLQKRYNYLELTNYLGSRGLIDDWEGCENGIWEQYIDHLDDNGVEIYEGDILRVYNIYAEKYFNVEVVYKYRKIIFEKHCEPKKEFNIFDFFVNHKEIEIIGDIHRDPELLWED